MKTFLLDEPPVEPHPESNQGNSLAGFDVIRYSPDCKSEWDAFVTGAKNSTFLFYRDYMDYHQDRFADHSLLIFRDGELAGLLPANLSPKGTLISHEGLTYGGLLVPRDATLLRVMGCFHAALKHLHLEQIHRLVYKQIPVFYDAVPDGDLPYIMFLLDARLFRRDCTTTVSRRARLPVRKQHQQLIKKALGSGVQVVREKSFRPFWEQVLVPQLATRYGAKPVHSLLEITLLASRFPEQIKQFSAYYGDEILAGVTLYETPTVAHSQYAAVTEKGRHIGAQACLFGTLIEQYHDKDFFDFGTSNENEGRALNQGLLKWKEGFGARCYTHDFYEIFTGCFTNLDPFFDG